MRTGLRLVVGAAILASFVSTSAHAENRTTIQIVTVLASMEGRTFDPRLVGLKSALKPLGFRSYSLVNSDTRVLHGSSGQCGVELPNGRYLHITTDEHTSDHVRLHILLNEDNHPVVNTFVKLEMGSVVMLGGPRDQNGTLVIRIGSRPWRSEDDDSGEEKAIPIPQSGQEPTPTPGAAHELPAAAPRPPSPAVAVGLPPASGH